MSSKKFPQQPQIHTPKISPKKPIHYLQHTNKKKIQIPLKKIINMYTKPSKSQTPTTIFKLQIRRKHRQQIRRDIMNQFQQLEQFQLCLETFCNMAHNQLIQIVKREDEGRKFYGEDCIGMIKGCGNDGHCQNICWNTGMNMLDSNPWDFVKVSKLAQQLSYLLNTFPDKWLQQLLQNQPQQTHKSTKIYQNLQNTITIYIPHLIYIIEECQRVEQSRLEYQNKKYLWPNISLSEQQKLPNLFPKVQVSKINVGKFVGNLIGVLMKFTYIYELHHAFIFVNPCQTTSASQFYPYIYHNCYELQPLRLLTRHPTSFILPNSTFYASLISIGNLLHHLHIEQSNKNPQKIRDNDIRRYIGIDSGDNIYKHVYQVLLDSDLECILAVSLGRIVQEQEEDGEGCQGVILVGERVDQNCEEVIIWFISLSFPIFTLDLLTQKIQSYIYTKLKSLQHKTQTTPIIPKPQLTLLKHITSIIEYIHLKFQNLIIINTVIPLMRRNWHEYVISKLWLYLTFNGDYDLHQLFNIQFQQVYIFQNRDKVTVKCQRFYENYRDSISNEQQRQDDRQQHINQSQNDNQITFRPTTPTINPTTRILQQIFTVILHQNSQKSRQRNINLLQGIFNIILEMQNKEAIHLWRSIFMERQQFVEIFEIKQIQSILGRIQEYLDQIGQ